MSFALGTDTYFSYTINPVKQCSHYGVFHGVKW